GFILMDYEEREYQLLSEKTGIPVDEVPTALGAYDELFPHEGGWLAHWSSSNIRFLEIFPRPFMGIGAFLRRRVYTDAGQYRDLALSGQHTHTDLVKWNNLGVRVLAESRLVPTRTDKR
ncbi:MAG TPA: hypothetical protein VM098_04490, partial [Phycisphaerae bacterium]|nr:hypothetical protein [Phycisphaerae bacterium]